MTKHRIAIAGVSGYTGIELYKMLVRHPQVEIAAMTSEQSAGQYLNDVFPLLRVDKSTASNRRLQKLDEVDPTSIDTIFMCLPPGGAAEWVAKHAAHLPQVIDLSADFRLRDSGAYPQWYQFVHPQPDLLNQFVYGLSELNRDEIQGAKLIANPGCYPTCILLGVVPLLRSGSIRADSTIIIDAKSGISGAGRKATLTNAFVESNENLSPYGVGNSHRHVPEIRQSMTYFGSGMQEIVFTPHLIPITRGMISTIYARLADGITADHARAVLEETYCDAKFVHVLKTGVATVGHVTRSNDCVLSVHQAGEHLIIVSAIDNLLKGASGQAIQNFNISHNFAEVEGIR